MTLDSAITLGCVICDVTADLPLDAEVSDRARPFLLRHADCVTFVDLNGTSLLRTLAAAT